jgi:hypothetical protein
VEVTVSISDDTSTDMTPSCAFTQAYAFIITANFTDLKLGEGFGASLNRGDTQGYCWYAGSIFPMTPGTPYRLVVYARPGVSPRLFISFSRAASPTFTFS